MLRSRIARLCAPKASTAWDLLGETFDVLQEASWPRDHAARMRYLPTGLESLDKRLMGGFRVGTLTELVGRAGSGKTQMAMQAIVVAASFGQGAIYIDTEQKLSLSRLQEIALQRYSNNGRQLQGREDSSGIGFSQFVSPASVLENLTVHTPARMEELNSVLGSLEEEISVRNQDSSSTREFPVRLLILDSIAAPARRDFAAGSAPQRAAAVMRCAQTLKRLADQFQLGVLIINQVDGGGSWGQTQTTDTRTVARMVATTAGGAPRAALGTAWHHCVTTRIQLEHESGDSATIPMNEHGSTIPKRRVSVVKSNTVGPGDPVAFIINNSGLANSLQ